MNSNCSNFLDMRNLQEQVKKAFCYQKLFCSFTVWINCFCDLKIFTNSRPSALNFKSFSWLLEQFFLTVVQNNLGNKIPFLISKDEILFIFIVKYWVIGLTLRHFRLLMWPQFWIYGQLIKLVAVLISCRDLCLINNLVFFWPNKA